jgi:type II secretory pathway predicted ATPase ExeA
MLVGRSSESAQIDRLLNEVRGGAGRPLAVLGEPGIGKTALLQYAEQQSAAMKRLSIVGVAAEAALPYAGLHELLRPVLWGLEALPARQSRAIKLALGAEGDDATDALAVYAGVLALLAEVASDEPLIVIVDDAHWLDIETVNALAFAARRIEDQLDRGPAGRAVQRAVRDARCSAVASGRCRPGCRDGADRPGRI